MFSILLNLWIIESFANEPLCCKNSVVRISDGLSFGWSTYKPLAIFSECDNGWSGITALSIGNNFGYLVFDDSDAGVRSAKVDADNVRRFRKH